ncbi:MAG: hypothetical protein F6K55_07670 [Moorea sp. SIO4A3]|nr:hypothetical protein [Moorena sp. SIO4A3]
MIDIDTFIKAILEPLARCQFYAGLIPATGKMPVLRGADSGHWQDASSTQELFPGYWQDASSTQGLFPSHWQDASSTRGLFTGHWQDASSTRDYSPGTGKMPVLHQDASSTARCQFYGGERGRGKRENRGKGKRVKG